MKLGFKTRKLNGFIKKVNLRLGDSQYALSNLQVFGVTKEKGISITGNVTSSDLSNYLVIEGNTFAYNPYRVNIGSIGLAPVGFKGLISPAYIAFYTTSELNSEFLLHYLKSDIGIKLINWYGNRGGVRNALRFEDLEKVDIPDLTPEQQLKALILIKRGREINHQLVIEIEQQSAIIHDLRQSILQDAIQGKLVPQDPTDEPASVLLERIKKERQGLIDTGQLRKSKTSLSEGTNKTRTELPRGWAICRLCDLGTFLGGGTPSKEIAEYWKGDIPWITPKDMKSKIIYDSIDHINEVAILNSSAKLIDEGAILMVVRGMVLTKSFPVAICKVKATINQDMKAIELFDKNIVDYILLFLSASESSLKVFVERSSHGTGKLDSKILFNYPVSLPPFKEQQRIAAKVEQLMRLCDKMEQQIIQSKAEAEQLLQSVLREAFEGKHFAPKKTCKQNEVIWQKQLLTSYINMLMEQHQEQGEMAIAKYTYLNDRVHDAGSGFRYVQHNFGPYSSEIKDCLTAPNAPFSKKTVGKKGYEVYHVNKELEAGFIDPENVALQEAQKGFRQLMQVFSVFSMQERARQLELVASLCWLIEQCQTADIDILYNGLENWPTPKRQVSHKGQLFSKDEAATGLQLIQQQGWCLKLLHQ